MRKIGNKDYFSTFTTGDPISGRSQIQTKHLITVFFFFLRIFDTMSLMYFGWFCLKKNPTKCARNTWVSVSSWRLCTGYPATHLSFGILFSKLYFFFAMTVFKREIISQSVVTLLKILVIVFLCAISEMQ